MFQGRNIIVLGLILVSCARLSADEPTRSLPPKLTLAEVGPVEILGPNRIPMHLKGTWEISLCCSKVHAWIRYQNVETGEVHTVGRYAKGAGGHIDPKTRERTWPKARQSGVQWNMELKLERRVAAGYYRLLSIKRTNPRVYRGSGSDYLNGHGRVRNNCASYARDAWAFYTGITFPMPVFHDPADLRQQVIRRHPHLQARH